MFAAAIVWMVGMGFLLGFGVSFIVKLVRVAHPAIWSIALIVVAALVLGGIKARYVLTRYADKAIARIERRGHTCIFGFFSWASWGFVALMMGGGIVLRVFTPLPNLDWGLVFLATLYIGVGTGLLIADRIFWVSALRSEEVHKSLAE
jgi:hypothetical protein